MNPAFSRALAVGVWPMTAAILLLQVTHAAPKKESGASTEKEEEESTKTVAELTVDAEKIPGLFTVYRDKKKGTVYLEIRRNQLGKEFIYFTHTRDGIPALGHFRGNFHQEQIFTVERNYGRIEFVAPNTAFYFNKKNPLSRAAGANISPAILASEEIAAEDEKRGVVLIDAGKVFLTEAFHKVSPRKNPDNKDGDRLTLGSLNKDKTKFLSLRNYPENSVFVVEYVYDNPESKGGERNPEVTDPRYVSIELQHTLIRMPRNKYDPRFDDPRVGYFTKEVTDLTSTSATPYRDVINRWHLVKKDPEAALSEPVEPIVWWIENTTPRELRDTIREAALLWNEAFEPAGFRNALAVEVQPDDADWDAGDIRYNVLRWTSSPSPPFGGYGPSFINPRTGQILGADIMLEYVFLTNRLKQGEVFDRAALNRFQEDATAPGRPGCQLGFGLQKNNLVGVSALQARGLGRIEMDTLIKESLHYLVLHEIGHTLGLSHNMKASQLHGLRAIHDRAVTEKQGLTGSVMDYPTVNIAPKGTEQGQYYTSRPGPYDHWAITYGYSPALKSAKEERKRLAAILSRSTERELVFGNDADDMRSPGRGIDPRVMIDDLSSDAIGYAAERCELVAGLLQDLLGKAAKEGESYHGLRDAYLILTGSYDDAMTTVSRYIGGVYVDRAFVGQEGAGEPFTPVAAEDQRRAMAALSKYLFSPAAFSADERLLAHLQQQRRGFGFHDETEDPKIHARLLEIQENVLNHLLHRRVLERISDSEKYGNNYSLAEVFGDLTSAITGGDDPGEINSFRRQLQSRYVDRLIGLSGIENASAYPENAKAMAFFQLTRIQEEFAENAKTGDEATQAHKAFVLHRIRKAMEE